MLKVRITYVGDDDGKAEKDRLVSILEKQTEVLAVSQIYKSRKSRGSLYESQYVDCRLEGSSKGKK